MAVKQRWFQNEGDFNAPGEFQFGQIRRFGRGVVSKGILRGVERRERKAEEGKAVGEEMHRSFTFSFKFVSTYPRE